MTSYKYPLSGPFELPKTYIKPVIPNESLEDMLKVTGCLEIHNAILECIATHQDWRKCQDEVKKFKKCMDEHKRQQKLVNEVKEKESQEDNFKQDGLKTKML